jgi:hypothetical protein
MRSGHEKVMRKTRLPASAAGASVAAGAAGCVGPSVAAGTAGGAVGVAWGAHWASNMLAKAMMLKMSMCFLFIDLSPPSVVPFAKAQTDDVQN